MESIKIPSILDPPDNPTSARGKLGKQKPKQTKSRNGKSGYEVAFFKNNGDDHFILSWITLT
jgi:hypothetical protein